MGHTLVTRFDQKSNTRLEKLLDLADIHENNKIPFGRDCDREATNRVLPYHITVLHWSKREDETYLPALETFRFHPCQMTVTGVSHMFAEEGSLLLYLIVEPGDGYAQLRRALEGAIRRPVAQYLHLTVSVSRNHDTILRQRRSLEALPFPFFLDVVGLDLYHIWRPTRYVKTFSCP